MHIAASLPERLRYACAEPVRKDVRCPNNKMPTC
jgi:hypothetical protein